MSSKNLNPLEKYLHSKIKFSGPITVAEYMKEALGNPKWGYYTKKDVFGVQGDFITAPEISQMFGELIGIWFINEFSILKNIYKSHMPECVQFIEMGPGRGTLMNDMLRVLNKDNQNSVDLFVYMIESSPFLRKIQIKNLCNLEKEPELEKEYDSKHSNRIKITWLTDITQLPHKEAVHFFVANEFFDALPVHKFQKTPKGHKEVLIDFDPKENKFKFVLSPMTTLNSKVFLKLYPDYEKYDHLEISAEAARYIDLITTRLNQYNGSVLIIDYGHDGESKDSFRAFKNHKLVDVFTEPGECDLTID
ncbi:NADH dehydrogenase [ubiquinone] complex assembly factor 7, partial [Brachionus plicatilis]